MEDLRMEAVADNIDVLDEYMHFSDTVYIYVEGRIDMKIYKKYKELSNNKYMWKYEVGNKSECIKNANGTNKYAIVDRDNDCPKEKTSPGVIKTNYYSIDNFILLYPEVFSFYDEVLNLKQEIIKVHKQIKNGNEIISINSYKPDVDECIYPQKCEKSKEKGCRCAIISTEKTQSNTYPFETPEIFLRDYRFKDTMKKFTNKRRVKVHEHDTEFYSIGSIDNMELLIS